MLSLALNESRLVVSTVLAGSLFHCGMDLMKKLFQWWYFVEVDACISFWL